MPTSSTNIDSLLDSISKSEDLLRYNSEIINNISENGGSTLYSYNNVMIVSNVSEELYNDLLKDDKIAFMQDLPLKQFGQIDYNLINQFDLETLSDYNLSEDIDFEISNIFSTGSTSVVYGKSKKKTSSDSSAPTITNENLTLSATTNNWFIYDLYADGKKPITFSFITPDNFNGQLTLVNGNRLSGYTSEEGTFNIIIKAQNEFGTTTKTLTLTTYDRVVITNTNLNVFSKVGYPFTYTVESLGSPPKNYSVTGLPSELTFNNGVFSGIFYSGGTYNVIVEVSNAISSDLLYLNINTAGSPNITSDTQVIATQYSAFTYNITCDYQDTAYIRVKGNLPEGLSYKNNVISGIPVRSETRQVAIYATNPVSTKYIILTIIVNSVTYNIDPEIT
jgi:hypothetical protein